jgi:hypothetical protein
MWLREVSVIEEREDAPPEGERNKIAEMKKKTEGKEPKS